MMPPSSSQTAAPGRLPLGQEIAGVWRQLPDKPLLGLLLLAWLAFFHWLGNSTLGYVDTPSLFGWLRYAYGSGTDDQHGPFIPLVVLGLLWWKREEILALPKRIWWPALAVLLLALALHFAGFLVQQTRLSVVGFFLGVYGLTGMVWGPHWLRFALFPFLLFAFCVPLGGSTGEYITFPLRMLVTQLAVWISSDVLGMHVLRDGSRIFNGAMTFQYDVAPACSGIRSLVSLAALTTIYGYVNFQSWWKRWFMLLLAAPLAVLGNTVRITGVIITGEAFGQEAGTMIEQKLGFVTFAVALAGVALFGYWLRERPAAVPATPKPAGEAGAASAPATATAAPTESRV